LDYFPPISILALSQYDLNLRRAGSLGVDKLFAFDLEEPNPNSIPNSNSSSNPDSDSNPNLNPNTNPEQYDLNLRRTGSLGLEKPFSFDLEDTDFNMSMRSNPYPNLKLYPNPSNSNHSNDDINLRRAGSPGVDKLFAFDLKENPISNPSSNPDPKPTNNPDLNLGRAGALGVDKLSAFDVEEINPNPNPEEETKKLSVFEISKRSNDLNNIDSNNNKNNDNENGSDNQPELRRTLKGLNIASKWHWNTVYHHFLREEMYNNNNSNYNNDHYFNDNNNNNNSKNNNDNENNDNNNKNNFDNDNRSHKMITKKVAAVPSMSITRVHWSAMVDLIQVRVRVRVRVRVKARVKHSLYRTTYLAVANTSSPSFSLSLSFRCTYTPLLIFFISSPLHCFP
jgi:hypothetical protein